MRQVEEGRKGEGRKGGKEGIEAKGIMSKELWEKVSEKRIIRNLKKTSVCKGRIKIRESKDKTRKKKRRK